jgi:hypothetical protein
MAPAGSPRRGWTIANPIPVPPVSRRVVKKASKIFSRFDSEIGWPSLLTFIVTMAASSVASRRTVFTL